MNLKYSLEQALKIMKAHYDFGEWVYEEAARVFDIYRKGTNEEYHKFYDPLAKKDHILQDIVRRGFTFDCVVYEIVEENSYIRYECWYRGESDSLYLPLTYIFEPDLDTIVRQIERDRIEKYETEKAEKLALQREKYRQEDIKTLKQLLREYPDVEL